MKKEKILRRISSAVAAIILSLIGIVSAASVSGNLMKANTTPYSADITDNPGIESSVDLREMFQIPDESNSYVHPDNGFQVVITEDEKSQKGGIWFNYKLDLEHSFEVASRIYLGDRRHLMGGADGLTFTLHNDSKGLNALGTTGTGLGVGTEASSTIVDNGLALEFDSYLNINDTDQEVHHKYYDITGVNFAGEANRANRVADHHLVHIGLKQTPFVHSTADYLNNPGHTLLSIYTKDPDIVPGNLYQDYQSPISGEYGKGWHARVHAGLTDEDIFGKWHDLNIRWDAENYEFTYEIGEKESAFYSEETYELENGEQSLNDIFGFENGDEKKVYWGFTGSTGGGTNYHSVALKTLPSHVEATSVKEASNDTELPEYTTESRKAIRGEKILYRSSVRVEELASDLPLADVRFQDQLDGIELSSDITVQRYDQDGNEKDLVIIPYEEIERSQIPDEYEHSMGLKAYLSSTGFLTICGLGNVGEDGDLIITEELQIAYEAVVKGEGNKTEINNTSSVFYSGTAEAVESNKVPIQVLPDISVEKNADKSGVYLGEEIMYKIHLKNEDSLETWDGELEDIIPDCLISPKVKSDFEVQTTGADGDVQIEIDGHKLMVKKIRLEAGEELDITYHAKAVTGIKDEKYRNEAIVKGGYSSNTSFVKEGKEKNEIAILGDILYPTAEIEIKNKTGIDSGEAAQAENNGGPTYVLDQLEYQITFQNPLKGTSWEESHIKIKLPQEGTYAEGSLSVKKNTQSVSSLYDKDSHAIIVEADKLERNDEFVFTYEIKLGRDETEKQMVQTDACIYGKGEEAESTESPILLNMKSAWPPDEFGKTGEQDGDVRYREAQPQISFKAVNESLKDRTDGITRSGDKVLYTYAFENKGGPASVWEDVVHTISFIDGVIAYESGSLRLKEPGKAGLAVLGDSYYDSGTNSIQYPMSRMFGTEEGDEGTWELSFEAVIQEGAAGKSRDELGMKGTGAGYEWAYVYDSATEVHSSGKQEKNADDTAWLEEMEDGDQAEGARDIFALIIPETIDYGTRQIKTGEAWYEIKSMGFEEGVREEEQCIGVWDARRGNSGWKLSASLLSPMKNEETNTILQDVLVYCDGETEEVLRKPEDGSVEIASKEEEKVLTDISGSWFEEERKGLYLRMKPAQGTVGDYKAVIYWELADVPGGS